MTIARRGGAGRRANGERPGAGGVHHGLWLLPTSWTVGGDIRRRPATHRWHPTGRATATPSKRQRSPETVAGTRSARSPSHVQEVVDTLDRKPVVIGHSLVGCWRRSPPAGPVGRHRAIDPAPFRGVLRCRCPTAGGVAGAGQPGQPAPGGAADLRAVPLCVRERGAEAEAKELYDTYAVPAPGAPIFQAALANANPWTEVKVDTDTPDGARC